MQMTEKEIENIQSALPKSKGRPKRVHKTVEEKITELEEQRDFYFAGLVVNCITDANALLQDPEVKPDVKARLIDRILTIAITKDKGKKGEGGNTIIISDSMEA